VPISLNEAIEGAKVRIPTVEGPVMTTVAPGSTSGKTLRLKGRGFTRKNGERGDQLVTLMWRHVPTEDPELEGRASRDGAIAATCAPGLRSRSMAGDAPARTQSGQAEPLLPVTDLSPEARRYAALRQPAAFPARHTPRLAPALA
jgi:DnaJ-class molecular chaperone